ncbi:Glycosyl transferase family 2 [Eubacterium uniforme]|uniref:Glycosyl transferase family 2 n=1 Tax=Eubacterium uniforme TaxID=39495 RepID=A0A1T4VD23_9FIRM|nr:glycosyltransferase family 2 protein [Eubacterium uniforme]SKA62889.1 Glycosyl transferase family 2 [Eubacterium uniforme]
MEYKYPFVSVILPTYNEEKYIKCCIQSLINQTYPLEYMEWIIIDGNSTDRTRDIINEFIDYYPIKLIMNFERKTPISLNMGIKASKGQYIIRFDAHASFPIDYIDKCVRCLKDTSAENVGGWIETRAEGFIGKSIAKMLSSKFGVGASSFRVEKKSGYVDTVPFGAFKREVFDDIGFFNEELLRSEDNDINARIKENGGKVFISEEIHSTYYCRDTIFAVLKQGLQNGNALFWTMRVNPRAMKIRHFIPFLFLLSIVFLPLICFAFPVASWVLKMELVCYFLLDFYYSFVEGDRKQGFVTVWLFFLFHISYGIGSFLGLVNIKIY